MQRVPQPPLMKVVRPLPAIPPSQWQLEAEACLEAGLAMRISALPLPSGRVRDDLLEQAEDLLLFARARGVHPPAACEALPRSA